VTLVIVHYHLRPGGIRRVIELAVPHLVRHAPRPLTRLVLATGEPADARWHQHFAAQILPVPVEVFQDLSFRYVSEQRAGVVALRRRIRAALARLLPSRAPDDCLVWAHNPGVGRNLLLARELAAATAARGIPLLAHHHDWWFDNRWKRWPEMRRFGVPTLAAAARAVFPPHGNLGHVAINHADAALLHRSFRARAGWLPNLAQTAAPPAAARVRRAARWLAAQLAQPGAPVWLVPCRSLRRKNLAEALLLTRWLHPEAWLVVTGTASSQDEVPYVRALAAAAHQHHWRARLGVLGGDEARKPGVAELLAASQAVLLTSIQEGFGLPYLEAAAARRPLLARRLPHIAPDLHRFGFRFPQAYDDLRVDPGLFHWRRERRRQEQRFRAWRRLLPAAGRRLAGEPALLATEAPAPVAFSRLTLAAQLEVLAAPVRESWEAGRALNPFLDDWRRRVESGALHITPWPAASSRWLGGEAYGRRFWRLARAAAAGTGPAGNGLKAQDAFIRDRLGPTHLFPLLWTTEP
jgi:glycosyltransferase involved in cell wall biosynthesis